MHNGIQIQIIQLIGVILFFLLIVKQNFGQQNLPFYQNQIYSIPEESKNLKPIVRKGIITLKLNSSVARSLNPGSVDAILEKSSLGEKLRAFDAYSPEKMFPHLSVKANSASLNISRIIKVNIPEQLDPLTVALELSADPSVEYAEPVYQNRICEIPNDSLFNQQFYLPQIYAPEAWDKQKGDSSVIIAIVDNGTDYTHQDLHNNVWTNEEEASGLVGVDDDGNGYIDDIHGWDFGNNDPDPQPYSPDNVHGTATAGIACAVTENRIGMAGLGWNCQFMPIKAATDAQPDFIPYGYEGIVYAADNGADVINVSWGSFANSKLGQEVINYATRQGAIVVCAAGNYSSEVPFYPASYHHAISVAAVDSEDRRTSYSNYGVWIDLCAPGGEPDDPLLSTIPGNGYGHLCGTSFSSPLVAGVCALIRALHPEWTTTRITRQLILSADDINPVNGDVSGKLGSGRINALSGLSQEFDPLSQQKAKLVIYSAGLNDSTFGNGNNVFERGETIEAGLEIQNFAILENDQTTIGILSNSSAFELWEREIGPFLFPADTTLRLSFFFTIMEDAISGIDSLTLEILSNFGFYERKKIYFTIGESPVLLLDHDLSSVDLNSPNVTLAYQNILNEQGIPYINWDTGLIGFPDNSDLEKYPLVLLTCSSENSMFLDRQQRNIFREYLDYGGSLFLAGQNIAKLLHHSPFHEPEDFLNTCLHAKFVSNNSGDRMVVGVPEDAIGQEMSFGIWQPLLPENLQSPDVIEADEGASTVFRYGNGNSAGIKYRGNHKVVYLGFGLEAADGNIDSNIGDPSMVRTNLLMSSINWLNFLELHPTDSTADMNSPVKIVATLSNMISDVQSISLFWRQEGEVRFSRLDMTEIEENTYLGEIPVDYGAANIDYYINLHNSYYDWHSPVEAPDSWYSFQNVLTKVYGGETEVTDFSLEQNYPNPFNPLTHICYTIPVASQVHLEVYNLLGQKVTSLVNSKKLPGKYEVVFDGSHLSSGCYYYLLKTNDYCDVKKMLMTR